MAHKKRRNLTNININIMKNFYYGVIIAFIMTSCGVPQADYDKVVAENERLKTEIEECMHGADKLVANVEKAYAEKDYITAKKNIALLYEKHPESPKNKEFKELSKTIEKAEIKEKEKKEAEERERIRLENLNNT